MITDEDLDREGLAALAPYRVVINGTHCEYYSERMMDATEDYLDQGGRLLYLSGNGYYWVVAFRPDEPWVMEVRKLESGSRAWQARAGEGYLATTGERGGRPWLPLRDTVSRGKGSLRDDRPNQVWHLLHATAWRWR